MRVAYLQHEPVEDLGAIEPWLVDRGHEISACRVFAGDPLPSLHAFDWLIVMGGPMGIHDDEACPWLPPERRFIGHAIAADKLVLGVCLGAQFIADALGARVHKNSEPEIGWYPVRLTIGAAGSQAFASLPAEFVALHWHGDTFEVPEGATLLAESDATAHQAFEAQDGHVLAVQFHLEATPLSVDAFIEDCGDVLIELPHVQSAIELRAGALEHAPAMAPLLDSMLGAMARLGPR